MDTKQNAEQSQTAGQTSSNKKANFIKSFHLTPKQRKIWLIVLLIFAIITILGGTYLLGYKKGESIGEKRGKAKSVANPFGALQNPFNSSTGKVAEIKEDAIVIDTNRGEKKTIKLDDKTKITRKTEILTKSDLKNDQKVTVFARGEGDDLTATRIVLRD